MNLFFGIAATILAMALYARYVEPCLLVVRKIRIDTNRGILAGTPLRIALLSDFHYPRYADSRMVRRAIETANQFEPDLVLLLGDFFDKNRGDPARLPTDVGTVFGGIRSRLGAFGVLGNHDHWFDAQEIRDVLASRTTIQLIDNAAVPLELGGAPVYLVGVGDLWSKDCRYEQAVAEVPEDASIVLLSHNPDVVEEIRDPRIVVQFSGHTHGGQVRLPFLGALWVPSKFGNRYAQGLIRRGRHLLYVNRGVCSTKHLRFLCPPEVTWVELS